MINLDTTYEVPVSPLKRFGYTTRESAFLTLAANHGGYFLRRQVARFFSTESGGSVAALIQKAVALEHVKAATFLTQTCVYHLCTRSFYQTLEGIDNRNRRERQPFTIKNRLMGLDFVLDHAGERFLVGEQNKVAYFSELLKVDRDVLPAKQFNGGNPNVVTIRYFVDKFPIWVADPGAGNEPRVSFCFIDEGARTTSRFETYLQQYRALFAALSSFRVIYVAAGPLLFRAAERAFERCIRRSHTTETDTATRVSECDLLEYFTARRLYESGERTSFDRTKLLRLRELREAFSNPDHDELYERWKVQGDTLLEPTRGDFGRSKAPLAGQFSTHLLEHSYELFGTLTSF